MRGLSGELCEQDLNECESNPCQNNSTCEDGPNGYICHCLPGYEGIHCEIDVAVCNVTNETRCYNGGICEEGPGDSFFCQCQPGTKFFNSIKNQIFKILIKYKINLIF